MPPYTIPILAGLLVAVLVVMSFVRYRRARIEQTAAIKRLGFRPCPEEKERIERTVTAIENNKGYRYEIKDPMRLAGEPAIYYYVKRRHHDPPEDAFAEEEVLFAVKRLSAGGLVLAVKPSSLAPGRATRLIGAVATGPWDAQPDDLQRLDLPADLKNSNLLGALGPPGSRLYDLIDPPTLSAVQGIGDTGALVVRFRDGWCSVAGAGHAIPFRLDKLISCIRPILRAG